MTKADGSVEPFRIDKLRRSLRRAGASRSEVAAVESAVTPIVRDGTTTAELFRAARRSLRALRGPAATRYGLQRALQELGPTGFPFESFVARLWQHEGFRTRVGVRVPGRFVRHEIDVLAERGRRRTFTECKLRTRSDGKIDVRTAMYVYGRAADLDALGRDDAQFWIVSNGRFTADAIAYGEGMGLHLLGWNHPTGDGLRERVDRAGLHPVTALTSLPARARHALLDDGLVLCRDLVADPAALARLGLGERRVASVLDEAHAVCGGT